MVYDVYLPDGRILFSTGNPLTAIKQWAKAERKIPGSQIAGDSPLARRLLKETVKYNHKNVEIVLKREKIEKATDSFLEDAVIWK